MCLSNEVPPDPDQEFIYAWKVLRKIEDKKEPQVYRGPWYPHFSEDKYPTFYLPQKKYTADLPYYRPHDRGGFYFYFSREDALKVKKRTKPYAPLGSLVLALCRFSKILAVGTDATFNDNSLAKCGRAMEMEIVLIENTSKKKKKENK